jgi:hypothetical protein
MSRWHIKPLHHRFAEKIEVRSTGCWKWLGAIDSTGYGRIGICSRKHGLIHAHRLSWIIHNGTIPQGKELCHTCDNRWCVNPDHLFLGTRKDNMRDARQKQRMKIPSRWHKGVWNIWNDQRNIII